MASKNRYYINMNDGRVIAGTEETRDNIFYKEIDITWALAIRDGKVTSKEVINKVNAKVGMIPFSEMMESVQKMNVRTKDLHMEEHAQGADASADEDDETGSIIGEFKEAGAKPAGRKSKADESVEAALKVPPKEEPKEKDEPKEKKTADGEGLGGLNI